MKTISTLTLIAIMATITSGCISISRRTVEREVVTEPAGRETVITTLPAGYRTRIYKGTTYYYSGDVYYRTYPRGGYVVVTRPW